jgi:hypothetical protein
MSLLQKFLGKSTKAARTPRHSSCRLEVENLERREVPAGISYNSISHILTVTGGAGNDQISLATSGSTIKATLNGMTQSFSGVWGVGINGGGGANSIKVFDMPANVPVFITGGVGSNDAVFVELQASAPSSLLGYVNVNYGAGSKATLEVADYSDAAGRFATITNKAVTFQGPTGIFGMPGPVDAEVDYSGNVSSLAVDGGKSNQFTVLSTAAATPLSIYAGTGFNTVGIGGSGAQVYGSPGGSVAAIAGPVHVYDTCGKTTLNVDTSGGADNQQITVNANSVAVKNGPTIDFQANSPVAGDGVTSVNVFAPDDLTDKSVITVQGVASGTTLDLWGNAKLQVTGPAANKAHVHHYFWLT